MLYYQMWNKFHLQIKVCLTIPGAQTNLTSHLTEKHLRTPKHSQTITEPIYS